MLGHSETSHVAPIIGYHRAPLSQKFGAPRQPNLVALISVIEMLAPYDTPAAFVGLEGFSHIWISWQFHHNYLYKANSINKLSQSNQSKKKEHTTTANEATFRPQVRPPRLGGNRKIGVFASRSMYRPSGLGLSVVKLERVEVAEGRVLLMISGADMIDGTPIIDIKPYVAYSDALISADSGFAASVPTLLTVTMTVQVRDQFVKIISDGQDYRDRNKTSDKNSSLTAIIYTYQTQLIEADIDYINTLIAQDPRPAYRREELNKPFVMRYKNVDVSFQMIGERQLQITNVSNIN
ncbi:SAM-dependent methyltransferase [Psychrobacter frigidicola]|nr:tRNA (N6-threonylcarbamoyladenosine(37)-N6)-methyltransferase TrmO [Psychrobacter frigidicola]